MTEKDDNEQCIVTEIGTFGSLNIKDPTKKKVTKTDEELQVLIEESIKVNNEGLRRT